MFNDILNRHAILNAPKGHAAFGDEMLIQCCHRYTLSALTHAALRLQFVLPFLFGKINALSQESFLYFTITEYCLFFSSNRILLSGCFNFVYYLHSASSYNSLDTVLVIFML